MVKNDQQQTAHIYVVDDDPHFLQSIKTLLTSVKFKVSCYENGEDFLETTNYSSFSSENSCLLLDVRMPRISGLEIQRQLIERAVNIPIIFISGYATVSVVVKAMKNGASHFMAKPYSENELLQAIYDALREHHKSVKRLSYHQSLKERFSYLSPREKNILEKLLEGYSNKLIAAELNLSIKTIEYHRSNLMKHSSSRSLAQLIRDYVIYKQTEVEEPEDA